MKNVFISYRRDLNAGDARALCNDLSDLLGNQSVFMDVDSIALGRDFREVLKERLGSCDLMLVLIGRDWLDAKDSAGQRRLEQPDDFVRQEIATALARNIPVTPVLLQEAAMPRAEQLPDDLKDLAYRNGFELSYTRWPSDLAELIKRLGLRAETPWGLSARPVVGWNGVLLKAGAAAAALLAGGWFLLSLPAFRGQVRVDPDEDRSGATRAGCNPFGCTKSSNAECNPFGCPNGPLGQECTHYGCPASPQPQSGSGGYRDAPSEYPLPTKMRTSTDLESERKRLMKEIEDAVKSGQQPGSSVTRPRPLPDSLNRSLDRFERKPNSNTKQ